MLPCFCYDRVYAGGEVADVYRFFCCADNLSAVAVENDVFLYVVGINVYEFLGWVREDADAFVALYNL